MITTLLSMPHESAIAKVKWVTANEYAQIYGMSLIEAFIRTAISYAPDDVCVEFDIQGFINERAKQEEQNKWIFDFETIQGLDTLMKNTLHLCYPEEVLTHMFPSDENCQMILMRIEQNAGSKNN